MKNRDEIKSIQLSDYRQPSYWAKKVFLTIELDPDHTRVRCLVDYVHNPGHDHNLHLNGKDLRLSSVLINGQNKPLDTFFYDSEQLNLDNLPNHFALEIVTELCPKNNASLEGLYLSHGAFFSQCESQGFRRFTYYLDRPDVMAEFETTLIADKTKYPVMLSNGNLLEAKDLPNGKHSVRWHDPFPKPSYLFALVAGDLGHREDSYVTGSGRKIGLHIYVEKENLAKCSFAFTAIKKAMQWDEDTYGLEYDLGRFMVVAVNDFNMGAMENKGLNIFNSKYVLASPETATDKDFENILGIVGHEYFHNWSGNRVTLRDWFQLSLKEGLTVFRDQQFSAHHGSEAVKRILDVRRLRDHQFPEDDGPMTHPVRPEAYIEINNFYTSTVYEKGAEVVRMLYTLLGKHAYYKAMTEYFRRFDGQAITIEDMLDLMEESSGRKLDQFKLWYQQSGTPIIHVTRNPIPNGISLHIRQELPDSASQQNKKAQLIPFKVAFLGTDRKPLHSNHKGTMSHEHLLEISRMEESFDFKDIPSDAIPSLLRRFTAPVRLKCEMTEKENLIALAAETDSFNKYEAAQLLGEEMIGKSAMPAEYVEAFRSLLRDTEKDPYLTSLMLQTPTPEYLAAQVESVNIEKIFQDYKHYLKQIAELCYPDLLLAYKTLENLDPKAMDSRSSARRELRNTCLTILAASEKVEAIELVKTHYHNAQNMTDTVCALNIISSLEDTDRDGILSDFYKKWEHDILVIDKWFAAQAGSTHSEVLQHVQALLKHRDFDMYNPNRVYSVFRSFARNVPFGFHHPSGSGYSIVADYVIEIDRSNPQVASKLANLLSRYQKFDKSRQDLMIAQLKRISEHGPLSSDVYEVVSKSLKETKS